MDSKPVKQGWAHFWELCVGGNVAAVAFQNDKTQSNIKNDKFQLTIGERSSLLDTSSWKQFHKVVGTKSTMVKNGGYAHNHIIFHSWV